MAETVGEFVARRIKAAPREYVDSLLYGALIATAQLFPSQIEAELWLEEVFLEVDVWTLEDGLSGDA